MKKEIATVPKETVEKLKEIVSLTTREDGWAELAAVGNKLDHEGIKSKDYGYEKLKFFFENLSGYFDLSVDNVTGLPLVRIHTNIYKQKEETLHITNWASINLKLAIDSLSKLALPERWSFRQDDADYPNQILAKYLKWTFVKLMRENKILIQNSYAAFNTGLVDKFYKPIFAVFDRNRVPKQPWHFIDFCVAGSSTPASRILGDNFAALPERAVYIKNYDDVMYDYTLPVDVNWDHIVLENIDRLPVELLAHICGDDFQVKTIVNMRQDEREEYLLCLRCFLEQRPGILSFVSNMMSMAVEIAKSRVAWNYKTAIPIYYPTDDKVHLILPLSLNINEPEEISLALVMTKSPVGRYRAVTIFTLDMAYSNARLITKPSSDWLIAESI